MSTTKDKIQAPWLDKAYEYLDKLYQQAIEYNDEVDDILPTQRAIDSTKQFLKILLEAEKPQIAFSVNGEVVLSWKVPDGKRTAWIRADGHIDYYRNNNLIGSTKEFVADLPAIAA